MKGGKDMKKPFLASQVALGVFMGLLLYTIFWYLVTVLFYYLEVRPGIWA